jgi:hypothetical protein
LRSTWSASRRLGHGLAEDVDPVGIGREDFDRSHIIGAVEIGLRFGERHKDETGVILRHSDFEYGGDFVGLYPWRRAHRRHRTLG